MSFFTAFISSSHTVQAPKSESYSIPTDIIAVSVLGLLNATLQYFHVLAVNAGTFKVSIGLAQLAVSSNNIFRFPDDVATVDLIQNSI